MSGVETACVGSDEAGLRLDRWFRRHYPQVPHALLERWLRSGQVRIEGRRAKAGARLEPGQTIRIPPLGDAARHGPRDRPAVSLNDTEAAALAARVLYRDDAVIVLDKPAGLAVQGGTGLHRHLDGMLDALRFGGERPRLTHRLDKDTSGVLVLGRSAGAAAALARAFRTRAARKLSWALVVGVPRPVEGRIDAPLGKLPGPAGERMVVDAPDARRAVTRYRIVDKVARRAAWLALQPLTGRTHQLRAHCAAIGTPILGDGKYGGAAAFIDGGRLSRKLHLHARAIRIPHPDGGELSVSAPLPRHMQDTWRFFGFDEETNEAVDRWPDQR